MKASDLKLSPYPQIDVFEHHGLLRSLALRPIDVYCVLKRLYGPPNENADDYKSQFGYCFRATDCYVCVYDWKLTRCSIAARHDHGNRSEAQHVVEEVGALILDNWQKAQGDVRKATSVKGTTIYESPFSTYYRAAVQLTDTADEELDISNSARIGAFFLFLSAFEGLVNLIYEIYLRPDLREDRFIQRFAREQLDLKLRLAPLYCDCFTPGPIDANLSEFKEWHTVLNLRNDFIHANLVDGLRHKLIRFDARQFFVHAGRQSPDQLLRSAGELESDDLRRVKQCVDSMVKLIRKRLRHGYRAGFERLVESTYVSVHTTTTGRVRVQGTDEVW